MEDWWHNPWSLGFSMETLRRNTVYSNLVVCRKHCVPDQGSQKSLVRIRIRSTGKIMWKNTEGQKIFSCLEGKNSNFWPEEKNHVIFGITPPLTQGWRHKQLNFSI
jgi:hypothetical protein